MLEPYWMVAVNIIASSILILGILIYKYIFPKKNPNLFIVLLFISFLPLISILRIGTYESGDLSINAVKTMAFVDSIREGILFPQWAETLNATYGYPLFIFTYPLPYYFSALFYFFGFSFISSVKLVLFFSFILSGITMFYWLKNLFDERSAFVGSIFYLFTPIHLIDLHFRIAIGEMMSFIFMPLCLLFTDKLLSSRKIIYVPLLGIAVSLLILSHQAISLAFFPLLLFYGLMRLFSSKNKLRGFRSFAIGISLGLGLSAFYWLPVIELGQYTHRDFYHINVSFPAFREYLFSVWRHGFLFQGPLGELSYIIGYTQIGILFISCYLFIIKKIKKKYKKLFLFFITWFIIIFFLMQSQSRFIWDYLPLLRNFQFSYRLLVIIALIIGFLSALATKKIQNKYIIIFLVSVTIGYTLLNWGNRRTIPDIDDAYLRREMPLSTYMGEGLTPAAPKWTDPKNPWMKAVPEDHLEVLSGNAEIREISRASTKHTYIVHASSHVVLKENTIYFPGWNLSVNGVNQRIDYTDPAHQGTMLFQLNSGLHFIEFSFNNTTITLFSNIISLLTMIAIIIFLNYRYILKQSSYLLQRVR